MPPAGALLERAVFTVRFRLVDDDGPVQAWVEVHDEDWILNDLLAAGRTRVDGSADLHFTREAFNQQIWEREATPDIRIFVWSDHRTETPPGMGVHPTHHLACTPTVFDGWTADLGDLHLQDAVPVGTWALRWANTSRQPGHHWTRDEVEALSTRLAPLLCALGRLQTLPDVHIAIEPLDRAVGCYRPEDRSIVVDAGMLPGLSYDALCRLLVHEWAHAITHHVARDALQSPDIESTPPRWAKRAAKLGLGDDASWLVWSLAWTANIEGYAEYLEETAVRTAFPLSHFVPHADSGGPWGDLYADTPLGQARKDVALYVAERTAAPDERRGANELLRRLDRVARRTGREWYRKRQTSEKTSRFKPNAAKSLASEVAMAMLPVLLEALG